MSDIHALLTGAATALEELSRSVPPADQPKLSVIMDAIANMAADRLQLVEVLDAAESVLSAVGSEGFGDALERLRLVIAVYLKERHATDGGEAEKIPSCALEPLYVAEIVHPDGRVVIPQPPHTETAVNAFIEEFNQLSNHDGAFARKRRVEWSLAGGVA